MAWKAECNRRSWYCIFGWDEVYGNEIQISGKKGK